MRVVWFFGRENQIVVDGRVRSDFRPYLYAVGCSERDVLRLCREVDPGCFVEPADLEPYEFQGVAYRPRPGPVYKVVASTPRHVPMIREKLESRRCGVSQSYIIYGARASIDLNEPSLSMPSDVPQRRIAALDVEVRDRDVYIGVFDGSDHVWIVRRPGDYSWLRDVESVLGEFDYVATYNGWDFDWRYIAAPTRYTWCPRGSNEGCVPILDLFIFAESGFKASLGIGEEATSLYDVARQVGALPIPWEQAMKVKLARHRISEMSEEELRRYNRLDTEITWLIARRWVLTLEALAELTGISVPAMNQTAERASPGAVAEYVIHYKLATRDGVVLVERERELEYGGGVKVNARAAGVFRRVAEYDFNMLYPTTYYYYKLDPIGVRECGEGQPVKVGGRVVRLCFEGGPVYEVLARFYEARAVTKRLKKERGEIGEALDQAVKILANAAYGIFGKAGRGFPNEYLAAFIFDVTSRIFEDLWNRYKPIYGDTDSMYVPLNGADPEKLLEDVNAYVKSRYGEPFELKLEAVWDVVAIPPDERGRPLMKNYVKVAGEKVVFKGAKFKPREFPRGIKPIYPELTRRILSGELDARRLEEHLLGLARQWIRSGDVDYLFAEYSTTWASLVLTREGTLTSRLDNRKTAVLAYALARWLPARHRGLDVREARIVATMSGGRLRVYVAPGGKRVEDETNLADPFEIVDVLYIPINTRGSTKSYIVLADKEPIRVDFALSMWTQPSKIMIIASGARKTKVNHQTLLRYYAQYVKDAAEVLFDLAKLNTKALV